MERYIHFIHYASIDWLNAVAMRVAGATSNWVNAALQDILRGYRIVFRTWAQFKKRMAQRFELVMEAEDV